MISFNNSQYRNLIIFVESPNKTKLFSQVFNKLFPKNTTYVFATKGHITSIKIQKITDYKQQFQIVYKLHASTLLNKIKNINYCPEQDLLILATDPDREGEAIGWHLLKYLEKKHNINNLKYIRIRCNSLTYNNIVSNIKNLENNGEINKKLIDVYFARIFIDILIGINGSNLLWEKLQGCKSIGRVQSVVTYMLFERERMIQDFIPEKFIKLNVGLNDYEKIKIDRVVYKDTIQAKLTESEKDEIVQNYNDKLFKVLETKKTIYNKIEVRPLDIASLSSISNSEFGMSINDVYKICQHLYEGIEINNQKIGLITYMRTDSRLVSKDFIPHIHQYITDKFGEKYINNNIKESKKNNFSQESHEAIRITDLTLDIVNIIQNLNIKERKIAIKIFFHTIASFMTTPLYQKIQYKLVNNDVTIYISSYTLVDKGYYLIFDLLQEKTPELQNIQLNQNDELRVKFWKTDEITKNHDRYSEGSLISEMKKLGIGRPSTYSYITNVIKNRSYSVINDRKYYLISSGFILSWFIDMFLKDIINYEFTAKMEKMLDDIVQEKQTKDEVISKFFDIINSKFNELEVKFTREQILNHIQDKLYSVYGKKCICNAEYNLKFIHSKAKIICKDAKIHNLNTFGYKNNNFLSNFFDSGVKVFKPYKKKKT